MAPLKPGEPFNPYRMFTGLFIPDGLARSDLVSAGAKLAWGRLARYAGENGHCYPTMKTLGSEIGVGQRQAQKYIAELAAAKLISCKRRFTNRAQTSNAFEFLWHDIFNTGVNDSSGEGANDDSSGRANNSSYKESQIEESHVEERKTDIDCLPQNRKTRDPAPGIVIPSVCEQYPNVRECLARYMRVGDDEKQYPSDRMVLDILDAAGTYDEADVIAALKYLYQQRGLKPFTRNGPRSFAWFKTVLQDYFTKKRDRESAANPSGHEEWEDRNAARFSRMELEAMTAALEIPAAP